FIVIVSRGQTSPDFIPLDIFIKAFSKKQFIQSELRASPTAAAEDISSPGYARSGVSICLAHSWLTCPQSMSHHFAVNQVPAKSLCE
ncbi:hypothetical protein KGM_213328B, partial [Danaus plexippus plexippus]